jgi:ERCC4-related helicase
LIDKRDQAAKPDSKKVVFMVPTTNLVEQQGDAISTFTPLKVGKYSGNHVKAQKQNDGAT